MIDQNESPPPAESQAESQDDAMPRRGFLSRFLAGFVGAVAGLVPFVTGTIFFFDPLLRKRAAGSPGQGGVEKDAQGFINLKVKPESLPEDGTPQLVKVYDDVVDAWNKFPNQEVGSVWLSRGPDGDVRAFSSICPHLGCAVDFRQANRDYYCPCHQSAFTLSGEKKNEIPPRSMDSLQVKLDAQQSIWVKYEKFRATIPEKVVIS